MQAWIETFGVILLALAGSAARLAVSRLRGPYWLFGYFVPMLLVGMVVVTRYAETLTFVPPL